jgi:hypothetical protein
MNRLELYRFHLLFDDIVYDFKETALMNYSTQKNCRITSEFLLVRDLYYG